MENLKINIRKPVYGNFVYISEDKLKLATRRGVKLEITVPAGTAVVDPVWWHETGKRMEKVFKRPDEPMVLWGNEVPVAKEGQESLL